jgi:hypothetical protein
VHVKFRFLKPKGKRELGRPKHRWDYAKMYLRENGLEGVYWIVLAEDGCR